MPDVQMIRFVQLSPAALTALVHGDLAAASTAAGVELSAYLLEDTELWRLRLHQVQADPACAQWIARAVLAEPAGVVVGHGGFHGPPSAEGVVEVGYSVDPRFRRQGFATAILADLVQRAVADPQVIAIRASIRPDNAGSQATAAKFGFHKIGEQWDPVDGLEDVLLRAAE